MTKDQLIDLIQCTLREPRRAAAVILDLGLPGDVLWTALALVSVVNTFVLHLLIQASPAQQMFPSYFASPLVVFVLLTGIMAIYVHALYWAALALSGKGQLNDLLALIVWLQIMRTGLQLLVLVLTMLLPAVATLASLGAFVWGVWVLLAFMTAAMHLSSIGHAMAVAVVGVLGMIFGLGILLAIVGIVAQGAF